MISSRTLTLGAIALAVAACSSSGTPKKTAAPAPAAAPAAGTAASAGAAGNTAGDTLLATEILVDVINNRIPPNVVTVYVIGPSIGRHILGDVPSNQKKAFSFRAGNLNGDYRLIAQYPGGVELASQRFNLTPTLRFLQWSLDVNSIVQYETPR